MAVFVNCSVTSSALTVEEFLASFPTLSLELTYGTYSGTATNVSSGITNVSNFNAAAPTFGVGMNVRIPASDSMKYFSEKSWWEVGYLYNATTEDKRISYLSANFISEGDAFYSGVGINMSYWNQDISGSIGAQCKFGLKLADNMYAGAKYVFLSGTKPTTGYNNYYKIYHLVLDFNLVI